MKSNATLTTENNNCSIPNNSEKQQHLFQLIDNRSEAIIQRQVLQLIRNGQQTQQVAQLQALIHNRNINQQNSLLQKEEDLSSGEKQEPLLFGKVTKETYLEALLKATTSMADEVLAKINQTSADCPYINYWFALCKSESAEQMEKYLRRYVPGLQDAVSWEETIVMLTNKVRKGLEANIQTGSLEAVPEEVPKGLEQANESKSDGQTAQLCPQLCPPDENEAPQAPLLGGGMKRSTRMYGLADLEESTNSGVKKKYTSRGKSRDVRLGLLQTTLDGSLKGDQKRYNVLEILLEDIGGNSKGNHLVTNDEDLLNIFEQVCTELDITVEWTKLNV